MSRHEGVSCDSCLKGNFRNRRYKCLICYDYDLCAACYEAGATNTRHNVDHPMQCILTRADFELYYGGETLANADLPQSFTCPFCGRMGFTDVTLQEHVTSDHADTSCEVVCPICAAMPGGDPNFMTDDLAGHLALEHRTGPRDLISFLDEPVVTRHNVHRISQARRGVGAQRTRRSNMHFSVFSSSSGLSSLSPSSRETVDPIAELLSQLSGVRRSATNASVVSSSTPTQLQQLQMQLQLERQQVTAARQHLERLPRRQTPSQTNARDANTSAPSQTSNMLLSTAPPATSAPIAQQSNNFLLDSVLEGKKASAQNDDQGYYRTRFLQELIFSSMTKRKEKVSLKGRSGASPPPQPPPPPSSSSSETPSTAAPPKPSEVENVPPKSRSRVRGRGRTNGQMQQQQQQVQKVRTANTASKANPAPTR